MTLLPQSTINRLTNARLKVSHAKMGTKQGSHKSIVTGCSNDFAQHRQYAPGDEPKRIDWRVLARTNRLMVRQYDQETNLRATFLLDSSASMGYRDRAPREKNQLACDKLTHAKRLAAALAWVLIRQGDAVGLISYASQLVSRSSHASTTQHLHRLLDSLEQLETQSTGESSSVLHRIADVLPPRGLIVLLSDLFLDPESLRTVLSHFRHRNHEIIVIQVMTADEVNFPFHDSLCFCDLESEQTRFEADSALVRREYRTQLAYHLGCIEQICNHAQADYLFTTTDQEVSEVVNSLLARRSGRAASSNHSRGSSK